MANSKLNRTELIDAIAEEMGISKAQAERFLNSFVSVVTDSVAKSKDVNITGFGSFKKVKRAARKGVNPRTGESISIPATVSVSFKVGKTFKEAVK